MKSLVIAEPAARDLAEIVDYIAIDNPIAAEAVFRGIATTAGKLPQFPAMGRPGRHPETREISVSGLPHVIVYESGPKWSPFLPSSTPRATWRRSCASGSR